ncbi:chemotaxis protein CheB [Alkaliphilus hydrothermalis]|uniref:Two-component system CheB/CheR fusion protein n=1 Tax=Alkaliphilus hydrothermalis TaxID=1482730 RepID=A0ABS2NTZ6_9FIRM|nr:chemotaxis protein CheB [Alkaliphilus hydrothermalis]MBM7616044.1 two-component system CheB/CheR fusion protein [Alkaliphilus hydrothermalis]
MVMGKGHRATEEKDRKENKDYYVVGIGASAGGLKALKSFFENVPVTDNIAFVVVQHLSPDYKSMMVDILSKYTTMQVLEAQEDMSVETGKIYLIPPNKLLTIKENKLHLTQLNPQYKLNLAIDVFFNSLAENFQNKAIGVVLSGAGNDGTRGSKDIKEAGGMVMVQDEDSAEFPSMPQSIIITGIYDHKLPPSEMGQQLLSYIHQPSIVQGNVNRTEKDEIQTEEEALNIIYGLLKLQLGIDFSYYKQNTILRCIERRMKVCQMADLNDYVAYIYRDSSEIHKLNQSLLIGVTKFFRDIEVFDLLKEQIIPQISSTKNRLNTLRIWIAGCSTGEEVYSIAMLILEYMEEHNLRFNVKIFATDVNRDSIEFASRGIYPQSCAVDIPIRRLEKYFNKKNDGYQVIEEIRDMVIFSNHNIVSDPPFHKMDLVSCRNLFIYFQSFIQKKLLKYFHFALNQGGYLLLGSSETINDEVSELFVNINTKCKVFKASSKNRQTLLDYSQTALSLDKSFNTRITNYSATEKKQNKKSVEEIQQKLISEYVPPCVIIDKNHKVIHTSGNINKYIQLPNGAIDLNIFKMVPQSLSFILGTAINRAKKEKVKTVYKNLRFSFNDWEEIINVTVRPFSESNETMMIIIEEKEQEEGDHELVQNNHTINTINTINTIHVEKSMQNRINDLEYELKETKDALQNTFEEIETSNEELQSANEELLASNEELQSTNEEIQSINEELATVNAQYAIKIEELTELNNDMDNYIRSTNIGMIILDRDFLIRRFTPTIKEEINLMDFDIGRPIKHISHNLKNIDLSKEAEEVLGSFIPKELEVQSTRGSWFILKVTPYRTEQDFVKGVVITLVDITKQKEMIEIIKDREEKYRQLFNNANDMIFVNAFDETGQPNKLIEVNNTALGYWVTQGRNY